MPSKIFAWIKNHKLVTVLIVVVVYLLSNQTLNSLQGNRSTFNLSPSSDYLNTLKSMALPESAMVGRSIGGYSEPAPAPEATDRMVVQNSTLSLLVKNTSETLRTVKQEVESFGGYMVESTLSNPSENGSGNITVRIPSNSLEKMLEKVKNLAVKVVSENLMGTDVTDEYVDIAARIKILEGNKTLFESLMNEAKEISDILNIQQQIMNLQSQIDSYKGQQNYLEKTAAMAKITIYLSTDEYELPYAPSEPWRPEVVFKQAVRSLVGNLRKIGTFTIWLAVYSVVLIPILILIFFLRKKRKIFSPHN